MKVDMENLQKEIFIQRPVLGEIFNLYGEKNLLDYVKNNWDLVTQAPDLVFMEVLKEGLSKQYGDAVAGEVVSQIVKKPLVSTIEHHGIWNHPIFVNSALIYSLHFKSTEYALALSTESVSLNNTSSWSGSLMHHEQGKIKRDSFFPDKLKNLPVITAPEITQYKLKNFDNSKIVEVLDLKSLNKNTFSEQASILTSRLWSAVFPSAPKLLYLPLETLVLNYLLKVFEDKNHCLSKVILSEQGRELWKKYFPDDHTFMFWGIDIKKRRIKLSDLPASQEEILKLINQKKIYPSSPLCFLVLLYVGLVCVGGFTQTTWLTRVKEDLIKLLKELGENQSSENIEKVPTKNFAESSLAWLKIEDKYKTPTAVDLFLSGKDYYPNYLKVAESMTLKQSMELATPAIYSVVVPKVEQVEGFNLQSFEARVFGEMKIGELLKSKGV